MNFISSPFYHYLYKSLQLSGMWPHQGKINLICRSIFIIAMTAINSALIASLTDSDATFISVKFFVAIVPVLAILFLTLALLMLYTRDDQLMNLITLIERDWAFTKLDDLNLKKQYAINGKRYSIALTIYLYCSCVPNFVLPEIIQIISRRNESEPVEFLFKFKPLFAETKYEFIDVTYFSFCIIVIGIILIIQIMVGMSFLYHACGMFALVGYRLDSLCENTENISNDDMGNNGLTENIKFCVYKHQKAFEFVLAMEKYYAFVILMAVFGGVFICTLTFVEASNFQEFPLAHSTFFLSQVNLYATFCYLGQKLVDLSSEIYEKAYNARWYEYPPHVQKLFMFILLRSRQPCKFSGDKIHDLTYESFRITMRTIVSYFMVLKKLQ